MIVYEDERGEIIERPSTKVLEIRWFDGTCEMDAAQFNDWQEHFAGVVERRAYPRILIDAVQFHMPRELMDAEWRDDHIIPRYNNAGVERLAFLLPLGSEFAGSPPIQQGPAVFPTALFDRRTEAIAWLTAEE